jgi:hypothetical protein
VDARSPPQSQPPSLRTFKGLTQPVANTRRVLATRTGAIDFRLRRDAARVGMLNPARETERRDFAAFCHTGSCGLAAIELAACEAMTDYMVDPSGFVFRPVRRFFSVLGRFGTRGMRRLLRSKKMNSLLRRPLKSLRRNPSVANSHRFGA